MARLVGFFKPILLTSLAFGLSMSSALAEEETDAKNDTQTILIDVIEGLAEAEATPMYKSPLFAPACLDAMASQISCEGALRFTPDFSARVTHALAADDRLEMSAYDIGAALREQHDLIIEFDALYRATSALVLQLVEMRNADRVLINELRIAHTRLEQDYSLAAEALALAQEELGLMEGQMRHLQALLNLRDAEIVTLKAELFSASAVYDDELVQLRLKLQDATALNATLQDQLTDASLHIATLSDDLAAAKAKQAELKRALTLEAAERFAMEDALAAIQAKVTGLEADLMALNEERDNLIQTISEQATLIEELRALSQAADANSETLEEQLTLVSQERDALLARILELELDVEEAIAAKTDAEENWKTLFAELEKSKSALDTAIADSANIQEQLTATEIKLTDTQAELEEVRNNSKALRAERDTAQSNADSASASADGYVEELQLRDAAILILQQNLADAQAVVLELRSQLDASLKAEDELEDRANTLEDEVAVQNDTIEALKDELADAVVKVGEVSLSATRASAELQAAQAKEAAAAIAAHEEIQARCADLENKCAVIDDPEAVDPAAIVIEDDNLAADLLKARMELEMLKGQIYVRVERVAEWLTAKMVGREDQAAIEFEPRRFSLLQDLLFDTNSADLKPAGEAELRRLALILRELEENPSVRQQVLFAGYAAPVDWVLQIAGHADSRPISGGPFADNWELAGERAFTVLRYLQAQGVSPTRLQAASYGDVKPVVNREDENDVNRRVSFTIGIR